MIKNSCKNCGIICFCQIKVSNKYHLVAYNFIVFKNFSAIIKSFDVTFEKFYNISAVFRLISKFNVCTTASTAS